jgi:hypothetical protein
MRQQEIVPQDGLRYRCQQKIKLIILLPELEVKATGPPRGDGAAVGPHQRRPGGPQGGPVGVNAAGRSRVDQKLLA